MSRFMRQSKYRHVFASPTKKENGYENVKVSNSAFDTDLIAASGKYISVNWNVAGGGAFAVLPIISPYSTPSATGVPSKLPDNIPLARGHSAPVLDTAWSPFSDDVVASGGEDGKLLVWKVKDSDFEGWNTGAADEIKAGFEPEIKMSAGGRKVGQVAFHPTAENVLISASGDHVVRVWDITHSDAPKISLAPHGDSIQGLTFNSTGTLLATTSRDKTLRVFDLRAGGGPVRSSPGHDGVKGSRLVWLGDQDRIATTGFSKSSDRQVKLWETGGLSEIKTITLDQSSGVLMPFYSDANNMLFLAGKGDGNIRYYEYENDNLFYLSEYSSKEPQRGMTFMPRRALNTSENEVMRGFKISGSIIEPLGFVVPRKADNFQSDIFPPAPSLVPALTPDEFFAGKVAPPNLISLEDGTAAKSAPVTSTPIPTPTAAAPAPAPAATPSTAPAPTPTPPAKEPEELAPMPKEIVQDEPEDEEFEEVPAPKPIPAASTPNSKVIDDLNPMVLATNSGSSTPVPQASSGASSAEIDQLKKENAALVAEAQDLRAKMRTLELQVESMKANASKIAKLLGDIHL